MAVLTRSPQTLADVLRRLGNIPPSRILWNPLPGTATEADQLQQRNGTTSRLVELIDGVLVEKAMGARESAMAAALLILLGGYVQLYNLGIMYGADAATRVRRGRNRLPDVSFLSWGRVPHPGAHLEPILQVVPDLCVEILSPGNTRREIAMKRREYFRGGALAVWVFDPDARTVAVYSDAKTHTLLTETDTLTGGTVIPGWSLSLADFFARRELN